MKRINDAEIIKIIQAYGFKNLFFEMYLELDPDTSAYIFHDANDGKYLLLVSDYLGGYEGLKMPHDFVFDYGEPYSDIRFKAIKSYSYLDDSEKKAEGYIDDKHLWTMASTGDVCMLFKCEKINTL